MNRFPIFCIDDFYENPDEIRDFALRQEYIDLSFKPSGKRTKPLPEICPEFYEKFCEKIMSIFYTSKEKCIIETNFHIHYLRDSDPFSPRNEGRVHKDYRSYIGGVIYLNPNPNSDAGTNIYYGNKRDSGENVIFKNVYNRLVAFGGDYFHAINNVYNDAEDLRLTQVFFLNYLDAVPPLQRIPKIKL